MSDLLNRERNEQKAKEQILARSERTILNKLLVEIHNTRQRMKKIKPEHVRALSKIDTKLKCLLERIEINCKRSGSELTEGAKKLIGWATDFVRSFNAHQHC